ncbi:MAG: ABC transporter substrate-binding protein, partial [Candidatus Marinimicrobia bacterium]|nr:ABC transporter substrate-binding protein [Candidatus Neomarinimicrobiota bacterium]
SPLCPVNYLGRQFDFIGWNLIEPKCYQQLTELPDDQKLVFSQWLIPHNLFGSQAVRAALTMAIDRAKIAKIVNEDQAIPMNGPIPPILWAYNSSANRDWKYNPAQAQKVLKKEGWIDVDNDGVLEKDGREFIFEMVTNSGNIRRQHVLTLLQEQFRAIGVKMIPRIIDPGYLTSRIIPNRDFDALLFGWTVGLKMDLTPLFHSSSFFQPFHFTSYYSSTYDSLDEIARTTLNRDHARQTWDKIAYLLSTDLPYTWLYYNMECSVIHQRFRNVVIDRRGMYNNVEEWWIPSVDQNELDRSYSK